MRKPRGEWLANGMLMDYFSATSYIVFYQIPIVRSTQPK